ncbi:MAG: hypothetical protein DBX57_02890 [Clostridia bacterium]|nr:MAG: hypothetical protein DBX57_02890 [Clostridia bacterium]
MTLARPLFAYNHMLAFGHGAPISVSHTRRLPFRSPSEAHSPQLPLPHSHHRRLSGWKHLCDYSLFLNGLFDCPYLSTSGGKCQAFFCEIANLFIWPYLILQIWSLNQSSFRCMLLPSSREREDFPMKHQKLYHLVLAALFAALTYVATNIIRVPIPATDGYINLGDCVVLLGAFLLGPVYGAAAGGIGSALADILSGYAVFAPGTFVIKALIAVIAALIMKALGSKTKAAPIVASIAGEAWMLLGYFLYESIFLGYGLAAAGSIGGNAIQAVAGVILAAALYAVLSKVPQIKKAAA